MHNLNLMVIKFSKSLSKFRNISMTATTIIMEFICKLKRPCQKLFSLLNPGHKDKIASFFTQTVAGC